MLTTHGKKICFDFHLENDLLVIKNEKGRIHKYHIEEVINIIDWLCEEFGEYWFPLANNVQKLGNGTENSGLGVAILSQSPGDIEHAQGSSYLGVILYFIGIFDWNGKRRGIKWRIIKSNITKEMILNSLISIIKHKGEKNDL